MAAKKQSTRGMATTNAEVKKRAKVLEQRKPKKMSKASLGQGKNG